MQVLLIAFLSIFSVTLIFSVCIAIGCTYHYIERLNIRKNHTILPLGDLPEYYMRVTLNTGMKWGARICFLMLITPIVNISMTLAYYGYLVTDNLDDIGRFIGYLICGFVFRHLKKITDTCRENTLSPQEKAGAAHRLFCKHNANHSSIADQLTEAEAYSVIECAVNAMHESMESSTFPVYYSALALYGDVKRVPLINPAFVKYCQIKYPSLVNDTGIESVLHALVEYRSNSVHEETVQCTESVNIGPGQFCRKCGAQLLPGAKFCNKCGTPIITPERVGGQSLENRGGEGINVSSVSLSSVVHFEKLPPLLRRAFMLIEDDEISQATAYLERILDENPENAYAYLGKALVTLHLHSVDEFENVGEVLGECKPFCRAVQFADGELKIALSELLEKERD